MFVLRIENSSGISSVTSGHQPDPAEKKWQRFVRNLAILVCFAHLFTLAYLARQHPFGTYATETDFYQLFAPDAERIRSGQFPQNTFQGPGYPAAIALIATLTGKSRDLFTVGKWFSVVCAVSCGFLIFILFSRLFNELTGLGAQLIAVASGEFPQYSIQAATDVFFLMLCLAAFVVFLGKRFSVRRRVILSGALAGAAYLTRYNGLFLLATFLIGILVLDLFEQRLGKRIILCALFLAFFSLAASPWLVLNWSRHGSPFYNTNYLNIATEFYPELAGGKVNQDGTRALGQSFRSFGDVLRYDPKRILSHYPANLWESLKLSVRGDLVHWSVGLMAWLCFSMLLVFEKSKQRTLMMVGGAIYILLMALNHWETRYYFFVMVLYAGFAVYACARIYVPSQNYGWLRFAAVTLIPLVAFGLMFWMTFTKGLGSTRQFLDSHPMEILAARDYLHSVNAKGVRIVARKPHLPYLTNNEWVFFPQVKSVDELRAWTETNQVDYIAISKRELKERKGLASLGDPNKPPDWLKPVWVNDDPMFILYQLQLKTE